LALQVMASSVTAEMLPKNFAIFSRWFHPAFSPDMQKIV
jgi:hypothetical protein